MTVSRRTALMLLASMPVLAAGCADANEKARLRIFDAVWWAIKDNYYDEAALKPVWNSSRRLWRPRAATAGSLAELYLAVLIPMLEQLNASHIQLRPSASLVLPSQTRVPIPKMRRGERPFYLTPQDDAGMGAKLTWDGERLIATQVQKDGLARVAGLLTGDPVFVRGYRDRKAGRRLTLINHRTNADISLVWAKQLPEPERSYDSFAESSAIVRFDTFDKESIDWLLGKLSSPHAGLVLDLRNNRGGLISECHRSLSAFLAPDTEVGTFRSRQREYHVRTSAGPSVPVSRLAVLIGMRTMSSGEILADCLKRYRSAILVGDRTAGAVLASQDYILPDGWKIRLPYADFVTSAGVRLEGSGVTPDIQTVSLDDEDLMQKAKALVLAR